MESKEELDADSVLLTSFLALPAGWWSALTAAGRRFMDRSGYVLVVWWALFVVVHCVLAMLCCIGSLARATMLMAPSALHYVPWCMLWSSLLTLATCASCGTPPSATPQRREGHSVMMALCAWLPWLRFHGARQGSVAMAAMHIVPS